MAWIEMTDRLGTHPQIVQAGLSGWLFTCGLWYCCAHGTDGRIPREALRVLAPGLHTPEKHAARLVAVGLWHEQPEGYQVTDLSSFARSAPALTCASCGRPFPPSNARSRYCSPACRSLAYRRRHERRDAADRHARVTDDRDERHGGVTDNRDARVTDASRLRDGSPSPHTPLPTPRTADLSTADLCTAQDPQSSTGAERGEEREKGREGVTDASRMRDGHPLRDAAEPRWVRPAPSGTRPRPLIDGPAIRRHGTHRRCYPDRGLCVTPWVWDELVGRLGGLREDAEDRLGDWMDAEVAALGDAPVGDEADRWWRKRFAGWVGVEPTPASPSREGRGERTARVYREVAAKLAGDAPGGQS
jgi:hypothetical protein